jgi:hypothetical protein
MRAAEPIADIGWSSREEDAPMAPARVERSRWTDASKLSFPVQMVVSLLIASLSASVTVWSLKSDIRDITTNMAAERRISEMAAKLQEANYQAMKAAIESNAKATADVLGTMTRRQEMQQIQIGEMQKQLLMLTEGAKKR